MSKLFEADTFIEYYPQLVHLNSTIIIRMYYWIKQYCDVKFEVCIWVDFAYGVTHGATLISKKKIQAQVGWQT